MNEQEGRDTPVNELDMQLMIVESEWGKNISPELKSKLKIAGKDIIKDSNGAIKSEEEFLWGLLSYYTRDMRLGNLTKDHMVYASLWLDFAGDCLRFGYVKSFLSALSRVITVLELSQSKGGFLRRRLGTYTKESYHEFKDQETKKGIFGDKKKQGDR